MTRVVRRHTGRSTAIRALAPEDRRLHTPLQMSRVNPVLRSVLEDFDVALEAALGEPLTTIGLVPHSGDDGPVAAVAFVARTLGVPETDVLLATGIKERTFHDWKAKSRSPRLASQGRLWLLAQIVEDLQADLSNPRTWFLADPSRRDLLRSGQFDELLAQANPESFVGPSAASSYAIGPELTLPTDPAPGRTFQRRPATRRRITKDKD